MEKKFSKVSDHFIFDIYLFILFSFSLLFFLYSVTYVTATLAGLAGAYYINKDSNFPDKNMHYASFSLFGGDKMDTSECLAPTITDEKELRAKSDLMKCRMEAYITNLQGKIIKTLQEVETEKQFVVDRWTRKEVSF